METKNMPKITTTSMISHRVEFTAEQVKAIVIEAARRACAVPAGAKATIHATDFDAATVRIQFEADSQNGAKAAQGGGGSAERTRWPEKVYSATPASPFEPAAASEPISLADDRAAELMQAAEKVEAELEIAPIVITIPSGEISAPKPKQDAEKEPISSPESSGHIDPKISEHVRSLDEKKFWASKGAVIDCADQIPSCDGTTQKPAPHKDIGPISSPVVSATGSFAQKRAKLPAALQEHIAALPYPDMWLIESDIELMERAIEGQTTSDIADAMGWTGAFIHMRFNLLVDRKARGAARFGRAEVLDALIAQRDEVAA